MPTMIERFAPPLLPDSEADMRTGLRVIVCGLLMLGVSGALLADTVPDLIVQIAFSGCFAGLLGLLALPNLTPARLTLPVTVIAFSFWMTAWGDFLQPAGLPCAVGAIILARTIGSRLSLYCHGALLFVGLALLAGLQSAITGTSSELLQPEEWIAIGVTFGIAIIATELLATRLEKISTEAITRNAAQTGQLSALESDVERYRLIADNARDMIWTADLDLNYTWCSAACERLLGYSPEELVGQSIFTGVITPEPTDEMREEFRTQMHSNIERGDLERQTFTEIEYRHKNGTTGWGESTISFLLSDAGELIGLVGTSRDTSERRNVELHAREVADQLRQAQKIDTIGQLAGGIAHDFNNMLVAIQGYSDLAEKHPDTPDDVKRYVSEIGKASMRAENLTRQLLTFSRRQAMQSKQIVINDMLTDLREMLARLIPANVQLSFDLASESPEILGDSGQLEQLVVNLCVNARDAMPGGGLITVKTRNITLDEEEAKKYLNAVAGNFVEVSVTDTGTGMDPQVQERIFEPFFTTKSEGQGTGLGLSVVHGIVVEHGGFVTVDSKVGEGSTIRVFLPRSDTTSEPRPLVEVEESVEGGKETVLVVEDEEQVRDLATLVLSQAGYTVLTAADGMLGWELFLSQRENIAIIVCDVVMPNMGGRQLLQLVRETDETVPFIFTSGYVGGSDPKNFAERYSVEFLQKPFSAASLRQKVRETLDTRVFREVRHRQVLAVDDNDSILHLLKLDVEELGHDITTATSGEDAIRACESREFDVIFMDIQMSPMNGIETTRVIRQRFGQEPRIMGLTAHHTDAERERCLEAGMNEVLTKPIRFDRLTQILGAQPEEDEPSLPEKPAPVFDLDVSLHLANHRPEVAEEIFAILMSKLPEDQAAINEAYMRSDMEDFRMQVHKLNGAARYCGVPALSQSVNQLESLVKSGEASEIRAGLETVNQSVEALLEWHIANPQPFKVHGVND